MAYRKLFAFGSYQKYDIRINSRSESRNRREGKDTSIKAEHRRNTVTRKAATEQSPQSLREYCFLGDSSREERQETTSSEVKPGRAGLVLGWVTTFKQKLLCQSNFSLLLSPTLKGPTLNSAPCVCVCVCFMK